MTKQKELTEHSDFKVGETVQYSVGTREGKTAIIESILPCPLGSKSVAFYLVFEDQDLPSHLQTQPVSFPEHATWIEKT